MRYNVHSPCAFRNRIAKTLGVLVGAALVATLGLPSAVQAQTPAAPTVTGQETAAPTAPWLLQCGGSRLVPIPDRISGWSNIQSLASHGTMRREVIDRRPLGCSLSPRMTHGSIMVSGGFACPTTMRTSIPITTLTTLPPRSSATPSAVTDYQHGPPTAAPTGLTAHDAGPDARRLVWDEMDGLTYESRYTADATDDDEWTDWADAMSGRGGRRFGNGYGVHVRGPRPREPVPGLVTCTVRRQAPWK